MMRAGAPPGTSLGYPCGSMSPKRAGNVKAESERKRWQSTPPGQAQEGAAERTSGGYYPQSANHVSRVKIKSGSLNPVDVAPVELWIEQSAIADTFFREDPTVISSRFFGFIKSLYPLAKCRATRGNGKSQRAVECLCGGNPSRFVVEYNNHSKSDVGAVCVDNVITRFSTRKKQFVMITKVIRDRNGKDVASYFCCPLDDEKAFARLSEEGFHEKATKAIKSAIGPGFETYPQKNEVCLNSYKEFLELIFRNSTMVEAALMRIHRGYIGESIPRAGIATLQAMVQGIQEERSVSSEKLDAGGRIPHEADQDSYNEDGYISSLVSSECQAPCTCAKRTCTKCNQDSDLADL